jgi:Family of unknown function (DUF6062)
MMDLVTARLPARSGADASLASAFAAGGCPVCNGRARTEAAYLESILAESVNDVQFRAALDDARGFCEDHSVALLAADRRGAGGVGAAILLWATLSIRHRELEAAAAGGRRRRGRRIADAARPPSCPACERVGGAQARALERLITLAEQPPWADAVGSAPFCLRHLTALLARHPGTPLWDSIEARQIDRLRDLRDRLDGYAYTSSHDRVHLQTDAQRRAPDEAAQLLGGGRPEPGQRR